MTLSVPTVRRLIAAKTTRPDISRSLLSPTRSLHCDRVAPVIKSRPVRGNPRPQAAETLHTSLATSPSSTGALDIVLRRDPRVIRGRTSGPRGDTPLLPTRQSSIVAGSQAPWL